MANIGSLVVDLQANSARFVAEMERARQATERTRRTIETAMSGAQRAFSLIGRGLAAAGITLAVDALYDMAQRSVRAAGDMADLATQLGVTTDRLQALQLAAAQAGVSQEQLEAALIKLNDQMGNAARGNDEAIRSFERLGVRLLDNQGRMRSQADVMADLATAISRIEDPAQRAAAANDVFGRAGARLLPILEEGGAALQDMEARARSLGAVVENETIQAAQRLSNEWDVNAQRMRAWGMTLSVEVMQRIQDAIGWIGRLRAQLGNLAPRLFGSETQAQGSRISTLRQQFSQTERQIAEERAILDGPGQLDPVNEARTRRRMAALEDQRERLNMQIEAAERRYAATAQSEYTDLPNEPRSFTITPGTSNPRGAQAGRSTAQEAERAAQALDRLLRSLNPVRDAQRDYAESLAVLDAGLARGTINTDEYGAAAARLGTRFNDAMKAAQNFGKTTDDASRKMADLQKAGQDLGSSLSSTIEQAIVKWQGFSSLLGSILQDIGRILIRLAITEPLSRAISAGFGSLFGTGGGSGGAQSSSAMGNILTPRGPLALAGGGIVTSPHLALIGEGSMNEAVVPLPDGRRIPVQMMGGGGGGPVVHQYFDFRNAERGVEIRMRAIAAEMAGTMRAGMYAEMGAGGRPSRIVGRRK